MTPSRRFRPFVGPPAAGKDSTRSRHPRRRIALIKIAPKRAIVEHGQAAAFREVDVASFFASSAIIGADGETPFTVLSGLHAGCFELFGNDGVRSITDLKGKRVGVPALGGSPWHAFLSVMAAQ